MKYEYPFTFDLIFKGVFGQDTDNSRNNLKHLLNAILSGSGHPPIESLTIKNPVLFGEAYEEKKPVLDIRAVLDNKNQVNIEIQVKDQDYFVDRATYYLGKLHGEQLDRGEAYDLLVKTIHIHIVRFQVVDLDQLHTVYRLKECTYHTELTDAIEMHCLQLPYVDDKIETEDMDLLTRWMTVIKDIHNPAYASLVDNIIHKEEVIAMAVDDYEKLIQESYIREQAEAYERGERLRRTEMNVAVKKGVEKGRQMGLEEGREEGREEERVLAVKKLLAKGFSVEEVSDLLDIEVEKIQAMTCL